MLKAQRALYVSLTINVIYSVFKLAVGVILRSFWWGAIAVYYLILALIRHVLLRYLRAPDDQHGLWIEYRRFGQCGVFLLLLHLSLAGIVIQMVHQERGFSYPGVMIYAAAAYTFYTVGVSAADLIRNRKTTSPVLAAGKLIRFAAALVSLLSLETAMLSQFGSSTDFRRIMVALTGAAVCTTVLSLSLFMIIHATKKLQELRTEH